MWVDLSKTYGIAPAGNTPVSDVYNSNNQVNQPWYDASGNLTNLNGATALYDAESRLTQTQESPALGGGMEQYVYDGNGQRIEKTLPGLTVVYVYNAFGQLDAEYTNLASLTSPCTGTCYLAQDYLGSVRLVMDGGGNPVNRHDFLPFGEEIPSGTGGRGSTWNADAEGVNNLPLSFTGQLRDREVGLDYFGARYYGGALGRFTGPDDGSDQDAIDPQSWNLYSYVRNNPLKNIDPSGQDCITTSNQTSSGVTVTTEQGGSADTCSGTYVNGTVDVNSYAYNGTNLGYSFSNDTASGAGTISFGSTGVDDWGPGSSNMRGAAQIGQTAAVGNALGESLLYLYGLHFLKDMLDTDSTAKQAGLGIPPFSPKIIQQMRKRGWTEQEIKEALENKPGIPAMGKKGPATRYVNPTTGKSIVVDNATGEVFHVGARANYDYSDFDLPAIPELPPIE